MRGSALSISIITIVTILVEINTIYKYIPVVKFQTGANNSITYNYVQNVFFSPDSTKMAFIYRYHENFTLKIVSIENNSYKFICESTGEYSHNSRTDLNDYSYKSGPLISNCNFTSYCIPQIWSNNCQIQYQFENISSNVFIGSKYNQNEYISFIQYQFIDVKQYDLNSKQFIKRYNIPQLTFKLSYSENRQYLITQTSYYELNQSGTQIQVFDTNTTQLVFQIKDVDFLDIIKNGEIVLGQYYPRHNQSQQGIYAFDKNGNAKPIIKKKIQKYFIHVSCRQLNFIITTQYESQTKNNILTVFNNYPQQGKYNQILQTINLTYQQYGKIYLIYCRNNKFAVLNTQGIMTIFQYIDIKPPSPPSPSYSFPVLWIILIVVTILAVLVGLVFLIRHYRYRSKSNMIETQQKLNQQSLINQQTQDKPYQTMKKQILVSKSLISQQSQQSNPKNIIITHQIPPPRHQQQSHAQPQPQNPLAAAPIAPVPNHAIIHNNLSQQSLNQSLSNDMKNNINLSKQQEKLFMLINNYNNNQDLD